VRVLRDDTDVPVVVLLLLVMEPNNANRIDERERIILERHNVGLVLPRRPLEERIRVDGTVPPEDGVVKRHPPDNGITIRFNEVDTIIRFQRKSIIRTGIERIKARPVRANHIPIVYADAGDNPCAWLEID